MNKPRYQRTLKVDLSAEPPIAAIAKTLRIVVLQPYSSAIEPRTNKTTNKKNQHVLIVPPLCLSVVVARHPTFGHELFAF
jgi:hypothetical protein